MGHLTLNIFHFIRNRICSSSLSLIRYYFRFHLLSLFNMRLSNCAVLFLFFFFCCLHIFISFLFVNICIFRLQLYQKTKRRLSLLIRCQILFFSFFFCKIYNPRTDLLLSCSVLVSSYFFYTHIYLYQRFLIKAAQ